MTYYEELGISADATAEQIRQAHRQLVKLLHPDNQQNEDVRRIAELQLTRVNVMVEELLDPPLRAQYDANMRSAALFMPARPVPVAEPPSPPANGWKVATLGACVVLVLAMFSVKSPTEVVRTVQASPEASPTIAIPPPSQKSQPSTVRVRRTGDRTDPDATEADEKKYPELETPHAPPANPYKKESTSTSDAQPVAKPAQDPLPTFGGVWLYAGGKPSEADKRLYRPEYIELRISEDKGEVHGDYRSRYAVTNLAISPSVQFTFAGKPEAGGSMRWQGPKGSCGTVTIRLINPNAMQVDWKVTELGDSEMGLEFGTATLVRRL